LDSDFSTLAAEGYRKFGDPKLQLESARRPAAASAFRHRKRVLS
jgi:hypothetical protein